MSETLEEKLKVLGGLARFEIKIPSDLYPRYGQFIYPAVGFKGKTCNLFKVLQTNLCQYNCYYCANRSQRKVKRFIFKPEELASLFLLFLRKGWVEGLFLSSGIFPDPSRAQEKIFITLELARRAGFKGYVHSVILPKADPALVERVALLSDRISLNLEAPAQRYLQGISPNKNFETELFPYLENLVHLSRRKGLKAGVTTQLVVGAGEERDIEILALAQRLYRDFSLERVYYSGFLPVRDTPFSQKSPCSPLRELRLYQADYLLRKYGFSAEELVFDKKGNLWEQFDPKTAWALAHPERFPLEINTSSYEELIRIPGIGRVSALRIINLRKRERLWNLEQLKRLGVVIKRARDFILLGGKSYSLKTNKALLLSLTGDK